MKRLIDLLNATLELKKKGVIVGWYNHHNVSMYVWNQFDEVTLYFLDYNITYTYGRCIDIKEIDLSLLLDMLTNCITERSSK